jgi:hypothetical protein
MFDVLLSIKLAVVLRQQLCVLLVLCHSHAVVG